MGWTFTTRSKGTTTEDFFKQQWGEKFAANIKATATKNGVFYAVLEAQGDGKEFFVADADGKYRTCLVVLIKWAPNARDGYNFGYKDMEESMGPTEADCPKRLLEMLSPLKNEKPAENSSEAWCANWRAKCWAQINRRANAVKLVNGMRVKLASPLNFRQIEISEFTVEKRNRKTLFRADNGMLCRIPRRCFPELQTV